MPLSLGSFPVVDGIQHFHKIKCRCLLRESALLMLHFLHHATVIISGVKYELLQGCDEAYVPIEAWDELLEVMHAPSQPTPKLDVVGFVVATHKKLPKCHAPMITTITKSGSH